MSESVRRAAEGIARGTSRRGLLSKGAGVLFGALAGVAAGTVNRPGGVSAGGGTVCAFPYAAPCPCEACQTNGVCAKPCIILTQWYTTGCWQTGAVTCCDCDCPDIPNSGWCGCGSDYHNDASFCP